jgi:hypothetical protein
VLMSNHYHLLIETPRKADRVSQQILTASRNLGLQL